MMEKLFTLLWLRAYVNMLGAIYNVCEYLQHFYTVILKSGFKICFQSKRVRISVILTILWVKQCLARK